MRSGREEGDGLAPADVAWVVEWQLATAFPWIPIGEESPIEASPPPADGRDAHWAVRVRVGRARAAVLLPALELERVIGWCQGASAAELERPPARVRASLSALRAALRRALKPLNPLSDMGYDRVSS